MSQATTQMPESHYTAVAEQVIELVDRQAGWFWSQPDIIATAAPALSEFDCR
jgi:hypothetical protein